MATTSIRLTYNGTTLTAGQTIEIKVGQSITVYGEALNSDGSVDSAGVTWWPSTGGTYFAYDARETDHAIIRGVKESVSSVGETCTVRSKTTNSTSTTFKVRVVADTATNVPVTGITLDAVQIRIRPNRTHVLTATITPSNATNKNIDWSSTNTSIAQVGSSGTVLGVSAGTAYIYAKTEDGGFNAVCQVRVITPSSMSVTPASKTLEIGETATLSAVTTMSDNSTTTDYISWRSSNTSIARVSSRGVVTAVAAGTAVITAYDQDDNTVSDTCVITVNAAASEEVTVTINPAGPYEMEVNKYYILSATVLPDTLSDTTVTFSIVQNGSVVQLYSQSNNNAIIRTLAPGTAYLVATSNYDSSATARCTLIVLEPEDIPVTGITVTPANSIRHVQDTVSFSASVTPSDATDKSVTWSVSDTNAASITSAGVLTCKHTGVVTVYATANDGSGVRGSTKIVIRPTPFIYNGGWKRAQAYIRQGTDWDEAEANLYPYVKI